MGKGNKKLGPQKLKDLEDLTKKQQDFIMHYMSNGYNATQAYLSAGYRESPRMAVNRKEAYMIRHNPNVEYNIRRLMRLRWEAEQMEEAEALARTSEVARLDVGKYMHSLPARCPHCEQELEEAGLIAFDLEAAKKDGATRLIKKITPTRYGNVIDFYPADEARRDIMKANDTFSTKADTEVGGFASAMTNFLKSKTQENGVRQIEE